MFLKHLRYTITLFLLFTGLFVQAQHMGRLHHKQNIPGESESAYSFIVAGHAYGSHDADNSGLHPALLSRLDEISDTAVKFIVLTGDIVRTSNTESWQQVEEELAAYSFDAYYCMGNHDYNDEGKQVFKEKFGDLYYYFYYQNDLFIVLNSIESDRSISDDQIIFLNRTLNMSYPETKHVFIFFHEIIWNSDEKYTGVRSNSRSRYDQMKDHSNYWEEVHPVLKSYSDKQFYLIAGDVGGNPDAIAAFYDRRDNVTLVASGMGEVDDENYLRVNVSSNDSVAFELVPLDPEVSLPDLFYFSVPSAPDSIIGPDTVMQGAQQVEYFIAEIPYVTGYTWELPEGMIGYSTSTSLFVDIDTGFVEDTLSVFAERDGFGRGPAAYKIITTEEEETNTGLYNDLVFSPTTVYSDGESLIIHINGKEEVDIHMQIMDPRGSILYSENLHIGTGSISKVIPASILPAGIVLVTVTTKEKTHFWKFLNL